MLDYVVDITIMVRFQAFIYERLGRYAFGWSSRVGVVTNGLVCVMVFGLGFARPPERSVIIPVIREGIWS